MLNPNIYECALDYGCGDGLLLKRGYDKGLIKSGYGVDIDEGMLSQCEALLGNASNFRFCPPTDMMRVVPENACDLAICTEVMEHVDDPEQFMKSILSRCKKGARLIVSVPIELGPSLLAKQVGRYFANWGGSYGYERYRLAELIKGGFFFDVASFPSSHSSGAAGLRGHKGFDYRHIYQLLSRETNIVKQIFSPVHLFRQFLNSTVIWVCKVR